MFVLGSGFQMAFVLVFGNWMVSVLVSAWGCLWVSELVKVL